MLDAIIGMVILDGSDDSENIEEMLINNTWDFDIMMGNYFSENQNLIELWSVIPCELKIIIKKCLSLNPKDRPNINELKIDNNFKKILCLLQEDQDIDALLFSLFEENENISLQKHFDTNRQKKIDAEWLYQITRLEEIDKIIEEEKKPIKLHK